MIRRPNPKPPPGLLPAEPEATVQLPAVVPPAQLRPQDASHDSLDRALRGTLAKLSRGVSPHAFLEAWSDWAQHLARAPGRQLELAEHARQNMMKVMAMAARPGSPPPFVPRP